MYVFSLYIFLLTLQGEVNLSEANTNSAEPVNEVEVALFLGLLPVVLAFSFIIFVIYRSRRESGFKRKETQLQLSKAKGELKALRAQINPHFIFNCLNSINYFIKSQEASLASQHLVTFSKLIRYVLESSEKNWVSVREELQANRQYLELEKLRMEDAFSFDFVLEDGLSESKTFIPPMLIQPFLENAVWHGLSKGGFISLKLRKLDENNLQCEIEDRGLDRVIKSDFDLSKQVAKSSMGIQLMEERFKNLNSWREVGAAFTYEDQEEGGRKVILKIPFESE